MSLGCFCFSSSHPRDVCRVAPPPFKCKMSVSLGRLYFYIILRKDYVKFVTPVQKKNKQTNKTKPSWNATEVKDPVDLWSTHPVFMRKICFTGQSMCLSLSNFHPGEKRVNHYSQVTVTVAASGNCSSYISCWPIYSRRFWIRCSTQTAEISKIGLR